MLKKYVVDHMMRLIVRDTEYDEIKLKEIRYGLEAIYLNVSRFTIFFIINALIGNFINGLLFLIFFIPIKSFSYGFHSKTSLMCFIISTSAFVGLPYLSNYLFFDLYPKLILIIIFMLFFVLLSPADTPKRPLINKDTRRTLKIKSIIIAGLYSILMLTTDELSTIIILVLSYQCFLLNPLTYDLFKTPYNNYLYYKSSC